jgi:hypothetical protein
MLRIVKIFNGNRNQPSYLTKVQQFDSNSDSWKEIPEVWISKEDEKKYEDAVNLEYLRSSR